jgi:hypothetical protein
VGQNRRGREDEERKNETNEWKGKYIMITNDCERENGRK